MTSLVVTQRLPQAVECGDDQSINDVAATIGVTSDREAGQANAPVLP